MSESEALFSVLRQSADPEVVAAIEKLVPTDLTVRCAA